MVKLSIIENILKYIKDVKIKLAEKILFKNANIIETLERLSGDTKVFPKFYVDLIKSVNSNISSFEMNNYDKLSLFETLNITERIHDKMKEDSIKKFYNSLKKEVDYEMRLWIASLNLPLEEDYLCFVTKKTYSEEISHYKVFGMRIKSIPDYPEKVYYENYVYRQDKIEEGKEFLKNLKCICVESSKNKYISMEFNSKSAYNDVHSTFEIDIFGYCSTELSCSYFLSAILGSCRDYDENSNVSLLGNMDSKKYKYDVSKNLIGKNVTIDMSGIFFTSRELINSILQICRLIQKHNNQKTYIKVILLKRHIELYEEDVKKISNITIMVANEHE